MKCFNCGTVLDEGTECPKCGIDVKVYKKIVMTSNYHYNVGLEKAGVRDLTGAIEALKKSLQMNKLNTDARNLLGLIYFEMGETVDALSEWVISRNYQKANNIAEEYLREVQNNPSRLDTINQTIKKYNQALLYCKQESRDLAIIQLKKVISLNPRLVRGHQLMALLYMEEGRYEQAKKVLRNAAKIDEGNTITLRYLKEINERMKSDATAKKPKKSDLISYQSGNDTVIMPAHFKDTTAMQTVINIVIGVVLGVCVTGFLLIPNIRQQAQSNANESLKEVNNDLTTKEQSISSLESKVDELTKEAEDAKKQAEASDSKLASYDQLLSAYAAFTENDMEAAGTALGNVTKDDLSKSSQTVYDEINGKVNEQYAKTLYEQGYAAYNRGNYETAIENLLKVVEIDETYRDSYAVYYLAQSYRRNGDLDAASTYYQKVIEQVPGTERARTAQNYVVDESDETTTSRTTGTGTRQEPEE